MTENKMTIRQEAALPISYEEVSSLAKAFVQSGMFQDVKQLSQAIVKIQAGRELGLPPVYSMQNINLIRGRLTSSAGTIALLIKRSGRYDYHVKEHTADKCIIEFLEARGGKWEHQGDVTWTMKDADRAGLIKPDSGWMKYPMDMLFARAISAGGRRYAPDAVGGMYTDEEIRVIPPRPDDIAGEVLDVDTGELKKVVPPPAQAPPEPPKAAAGAESQVAEKVLANGIRESWLLENKIDVSWVLKENYPSLTTGTLRDRVAAIPLAQVGVFCQAVQERIDLRG